MDTRDAQELRDLRESRDGRENRELTHDTIQIARLEERMRVMDRDMKEQTKKIDGLSVQLAQMLTTLNEAKGGWKTLVWLGGSAASLGAIISWVLSQAAQK